MIALLVALCVSLFIAAAGLLCAFGRAERRADAAERERDRATARADGYKQALQQHRQADAALTAHWTTTPREQPTQPLPKITRPHADAPTVTRLHPVAPRPIRFASRKDHLL